MSGQLRSKRGLLLFDSHVSGPGSDWARALRRFELDTEWPE